MHRFKLIALMLMLAMPVLALADDIQVGENTYNTHCVGCHQPDGKSLNGMLGPNFTTDVERMKKTDKELLKSIDQGLTGPRGYMPPWNQVLTPEEQKDVLAYIRKNFQPKNLK